MDSDHKFRKQKNSFDGHVDTRLAPITVSRGEIMLQKDVVADHVFVKKTINFPNKRKGCLEEEKYIFHLALLEASCVALQS